MLINSKMFYTITNLQGSQTQMGVKAGVSEFYTITNLQGSQTGGFFLPSGINVLHHYKLTRFSNQSISCTFYDWFYTITNLQGSQTANFSSVSNMQFYTITNLQGSQTYLLSVFVRMLFYTITNLQGSQTSNKIITEPNISVNMRKPPSNV